jgi:hypothetical protein
MNTHTATSQGSGTNALRCMDSPPFRNACSA